MAIPVCASGAHCLQVDPELRAVCNQIEAEGWPVGYPIPTRDKDGTICKCYCSCLAFGTLLQESGGSFKAIEAFAVGDEIMAAGVDLAWSAKPVVFSAGTRETSRQKFAVLVRYQNTAIAVTSDHLFLLAGPDKELRRADRLTPGDSLIAPDGEPVKVKGVHIGDYFSGFHHVAATSTGPIDADLDGHLLNTNGVISADYAVQVTALAEDVAGFKADANASLPTVGTAEYIAQFGEECLRAPELPAGFTSDQVLAVSNFDADVLEMGTFIPAEALKTRIPEGACSFLPPDLAEEKRKSPKRSFSDPDAWTSTAALIASHRTVYPEVTYHLDWASDEVNAYAWAENGVRHVDLKGGLVRDNDLDIEGVALVLANVLAHHYGGPPLFPSGMACEGQADFRGVGVVMRKVWFGKFYFNIVEPAIAQMAAFFGVPDSPTAPGGSAGCGHPGGACRIATYHAAVNLTAKPACAS